MSVIVVLISFSVLLAASFLVAFLWAVKTGQFNDRHTPAIRMLFDDEKKNTDSHARSSTSTINKQH